MAERIKVFFASSSELKDEREKCIYIANKLRKAHEHLDIDPVLWEHDMTHGSFPGSVNIQDAITTSELKDSPVVVFLFHSKIGQYTREEFDYATSNNKKIFIYFKSGFSPEEEHLQAYTELLQFKKSLNSTVLYDSFSDIADFENKLFSNLNLYFSQQYRSTTADTTRTPNTQSTLAAADIKTLMMQMMQEMKVQKSTEGGDASSQIEALQAELKKMREQLFAKDDKAKAQHEKTRHDLEQQLTGDQQGNETLISALEEIEAGNFDVAEEYLLARVKEVKTFIRANGASEKTDDDLAGAYYQLGRTQELQFDHQQALNYYGQASEILPDVAEYRYEMARMALELGSWDEALEYYNEALPGMIQMLGENSWEVASVYLGMATCFASLNDQEDNVIDYTNTAIEIYANTGNAEAPELIAGYDNLAFAYSIKEDYANAIKQSKKAIALSIKIDGEDNDFVPFYYQTLGDIYMAKGDYEKAVDVLLKAIDIIAQAYGEDDASIKPLYLSLGAANRGLGAYEQATECYRIALDITKKHPSPDGWTAANIQQAIKEIAKEKKDAGY